MGSGRDRDRHVDRGRSGRRALARRPSEWCGACRLRRRRPLPRGGARPAVRRLDPARQGVPPRGPARLDDERRAAPPCARRAGARGGTRLHRCPQRQVAGAGRGPVDSLAGVLPGCRLPAPAGGWGAGCGRRDAARARRPQLRRGVTGGRRHGSRRARRGARVRVRRRRAVRLPGRRLARRGAAWSQAELLDDLGPWAWRHWRTVVDLAPGHHEIVVRAWDSSAATQPENEAALWNPKGYVNNASPRIRVHAVPDRRRQVL